MYIVVYYRLNNKRSQKFKTLKEAFDFWGRLPFETFAEMYKIES